MEPSPIGALSLALGLGLLIGLQRERSGAALGGIRTFPLIALLGAMSGLLARGFGPVPILGGFLCVLALAILSSLDQAREHGGAGQTTEVAAFLTYVVGVLLTTSYQAPAIVVGGLTAVLLHFKQPMHAFAGGLSEDDLRAIMRFAVVSLIVLPVLPNRAYGPYSVLNPREIWWMVVLIVTLGLVGYVGYKFLSHKTGALIGGVLGGLVSSTATTVAHSRRARGGDGVSALAGAAIIIASAVSVVRVIVEVLVAAPLVAPTIIPPLAVFLAIFVVVSLLSVRSATGATEGIPEPTNPAAIRTPLLFAFVYATVIFLSAAAREAAGPEALYAIAVLSGTVDMDAVTLSSARLAGAGRIEGATASRLILLAVLTNLVFKAGIVFALGSRSLFRRVALAFAVPAIGGIAILLLWR